MKKSILIIHPEPLQGDFLRDYLQKEGYSCQWYETAKEAIREAQNIKADLILVYLFNDLEGLAIAKFPVHLPVLAITRDVKAAQVGMVAGWETWEHSVPLSEVVRTIDYILAT